MKKSAGQEKCQKPIRHLVSFNSCKPTPTIYMRFWWNVINIVYLVVTFVTYIADPCILFGMPLYLLVTLRFQIIKHRCICYFVCKLFRLPCPNPHTFVYGFVPGYPRKVFIIVFKGTRYFFKGSRPLSVCFIGEYISCKRVKSVQELVYPQVVYISILLIVVIIAYLLVSFACFLVYAVVTSIYRLFKLIQAIKQQNTFYSAELPNVVFIQVIQNLVRVFVHRLSIPLLTCVPVLRDTVCPVRMPLRGRMKYSRTHKPVVDVPNHLIKAL